MAKMARKRKKPVEYLNEPAEYMTTARGGCKLVLGGYVYRIKHKVRGREYYSCDAECNATVVVGCGMVRSLRGRHSHAPEADKIAMMLPCAPPQTYGLGAGPAAEGGASGVCPDDVGGGLKLEPDSGGGGGGGSMHPAAAGPSGYPDDVRVKMEPEWVDAGALEPNCELEGQYDDTPDFNSGYAEDSLGQEDQNFDQMYGGHQVQQPQQPSLIPDTRDPVKLHVPGKPNLTITVAPTRQAPSHSHTSLPPPPPLHLLNPLLSRKRGRPKGSAYGSYSESDDRVTTILTDSIIASRKLEKLERSGNTFYPASGAATISGPPSSSRVKPRSRDPEAVKAAEIVNNAQNRSGPRVTEELEKVHLKLRQEVLALEVQNLKAEREKLIAYRRNVNIRREIMMLHLQLDRGIPSQCASSGRGLELQDSYDDSMDPDYSDDFANSESGEISISSKRIPDVSISRIQPSQSPKIAIRKSLQTSNQSPDLSPLSSSSSLKCATPPAGHSNKSITESKKLGRNKQFSDEREVSDSDNSQLSEKRQSESRQPMESRHHNESGLFVEGDPLTEHRQLSDYQQLDEKKQGGHCDSLQANESRSAVSSDRIQQSVSSVDSARDDLVQLDSVSSDLSIEMLSEPGSNQWTQASAPMTEHEGFDDIQFDGDDNYSENNDDVPALSSGPVSKEPPDGQYHSYPEDENPHKRRRVDNMWEADDGSL